MYGAEKTLVNSCFIVVSQLCRMPELYSEPCQIYKMARFVEIVNDFQPLTIFAKRSILDV